MNEQNKSFDKAQPAPRMTVRSIIEGDEFRKAMAQVLPKHITADRMARVAIAATTRTPKLKQCTPESFVNCMMTLSQLGIEPDGRRAHLIPYENRKSGTVECQLIVDYKGLVSLIMRTGLVSNIHADVICDGEIFEYNLGNVEKHSIDFSKGRRGKPYAAYAVVTMKDGTKKTEVMTFDEIEAIRNRSRAGNAGPWVSDWNEMAKKTVFRRASKWIPLEGAAIEHADAIETALNADDMQFAVIEEPTPEVPKMEALKDKIKGRVIEAAKDTPNE